jgi:hypothetical protein
LPGQQQQQQIPTGKGRGHTPGSGAGRTTPVDTTARHDFERLSLEDRIAPPATTVPTSPSSISGHTSSTMTAESGKHASPTTPRASTTAGSDRSTRALSEAPHPHIPPGDRDWDRDRDRDVSRSTTSGPPITATSPVYSRPGSPRSSITGRGTNPLFSLLPSPIHHDF